MAKSAAQKGLVGSWLTESRKSRGYKSGAKAREDIERLTGWRIPSSVYAEWEAGTRVPDERNLARLQDFFGPMPKQPVASGDHAAVAAAIRDQTEAITAVMQDLADAIWAAIGGRDPMPPGADRGDVLDLARRAGSAIAKRQDRARERATPDEPEGSPRRPRRGTE